MLIFCGKFRFDKKSTNILDVLETILDWTNGKAMLSVRVEEICDNEKTFRNNGVTIDTVLSVFDGCILGFAIKLSHGDNLVSGRQWIVEIGCQDLPDAVHCSVVLETSEISTRVKTEIDPSTPRVVSTLLKKFELAEDSPGKRIIYIDDSQKTYLNYVINDANRDFPIILISPKEDKYLFDYNKLYSLLGGIAEILVIKPGTDTYAISDLVTDRYNAWDGAVNLIYPAKGQSLNNYILLSRQLENLKFFRKDISGEIFSLITHRINYSNLRQHISPFVIREMNYKQKLESKARLDLSKDEDRQAWEKMVDDELNSKNNEIRKLNSQLNEYELLYEDADNNANEYKHKNEQLESQILKLKNRSDAGVSAEIIKEILISLSGTECTPQSILHAISKCFFNEVIVLPSAFSAAKQSDEFRETHRLTDLLMKLIFDYRNDLLGGTPDIEARKHFGSDYSAKESETTSKNKEARSMREFVYNNETILMEKHLRIGVKDTPIETIRVHFYWDAAKEKIVIGYCGPHLKLVNK